MGPQKRGGPKANGPSDDLLKAERAARGVVRSGVPKDAVDDLVADVVLEVAEKLEQGGVRAPAALAKRIATCRVADFWRERRRENLDTDVDVDTVESGSTPAAISQGNITPELAQRIARRELARLLGSWTAEDEVRALALAHLRHGPTKSGRYGWRDREHLGRLLQTAHGGRPRSAEELESLERLYREPLKPTPAMVDEDLAVWLIPTAGTRNRGVWAPFIMALADTKWPPLGRHLEVREIALAAIATGWIELTQAQAEAVLLGDKRHRRWAWPLDSVDNVLEDRGALALHKAVREARANLKKVAEDENAPDDERTAARKALEPQSVMLPPIAAAHRRKGRSNAAKKAKTKPKGRS